MAFGRYPNLGVTDAHLSISVGDEQHSFHASREAPIDPTDLSVGPFRLEIVRPMRPRPMEEAVTNRSDDGEDRKRPKRAPAKSQKIGRNDPCFCGSGKKYKNCHGVNA